MAIVCIAGAAPGIGKTAVAELVLRHFDRWHAARVRVADEIAESDAPRIGDEGYLLVTQAEALTDDTEAERLVCAGAVASSLVLAEPRGLETGIEAMLGALPQGANLLVEGNAFLWSRRADIGVMVIGAGPSGKGLAQVRPSARELFGKIDLWAWNTRRDPVAEGFFEFPQALARMGFRRAVSNRADFHHVNPMRADHDGNRRFLAAMRERAGRWADRPNSDAFQSGTGLDSEQQDSGHG